MSKSDTAITQQAEERAIIKEYYYFIKFVFIGSFSFTFLLISGNLEIALIVYVSIM